MRDKTKAIKALGLFIAFLVVIPVISIFIEFGSYLFEAFASSDESRLAQISGNLSHFFEFLFFRFVKDTFIVAFFVLIICYILGVSDSSVQLISELDDKDLIDAMNLEADKESSGSVKDFASLLASAMGLKKKTFEESVSSSVENMQTQSNRLKNISLSEKKDEE